MLFNSYSYLLLLIPASGLFWALPPHLRRWYVLLVSIAYYATWTPAFIAVPSVLCVGVHRLTISLLSAPRQKSRAWLWAGISYVLLIFGFFRYRGFLLDNLNALLKLAGAHPLSAALEIGVPLGISFYSFEAISYLIDVKQGRLKTLDFTNLYLFIMFWPHLMAGPIVRFRELAPQFAFNKPFELSMVLRGLDRLLLGLVQKNMLANTLGSWVDDGFLLKASQSNTTIDNWALAVAFGLQIYFDFASYSNMAIGAAQLIGVTLPENFRYPYHAQNPADFWSRWHMTLSRWIRDYLFFPVNAKFKGAPGALYASLLGIMALVGLWHGAGWGFVLWGVMHGAYLILYRIWESFSEPRSPELARSRLAAFAWRVFTLAAVTAAWIPFRASTGSQALGMLLSMFVRFRLAISLGINFYLITVLIALYCVLEPFMAAAITNWESRLSEKKLALGVWTFAFRPLIYAVGLLLFLTFDDRNTQFIYFQF